MISQAEYVQIIGVDNAINKVMDPVQVGYNAMHNLMCSVKAVSKRDAKEKVGVIARRNGQYEIIEYSIIPEEKSAELDEDGNLRFNHGSILIFMINAKYLLDLIDKQVATKLYNRAFKKVAHVDPYTGEEIKPEKENAWKFELFIHNFLPELDDDQLGVLMVDRDTEFGPVKNADGPSNKDPVPDSPQCTRKMIMREAKNWLSSIEWVQDQGAVRYNVEISPLISYSGEGLDKIPEFQLQDREGFIDFTGKFTQTKYEVRFQQ